MATPEKFKIGDLVRRNTWRSTTKAKVLETLTDDHGQQIRFEMIGMPTDPAHNWRDASEFELVGRSAEVQPTQVPAAKSEFKVGDRVYYDKDPSFQGTICAPGEGFYGAVVWVQWDKREQPNPISKGQLKYLHPFEEPKFKVGDHVKDNRFGSGTIVKIGRNDHKTWDHRVEFDNGAGTYWAHPEDLTRIATRPGEKASDLINEPRFKPGDRVITSGGQKATVRHVGQVSITIRIDGINGNHSWKPEDLSPLDEPQFKVGDRVVTHPDIGMTGTISEIRPGGPKRLLYDVLWDSGNEGVSYLDTDLRHAPLFLDEFANRKPDWLAHFRQIFATNQLLTETQTMNPIKIENKTFVNGQDVTHLDDTHIVSLIQASESQIKVLKELDHKPKRIEKLIAELQDGITKLVAVLDERDETKH